MTRFEPADPDFEARCRDSFSRQGAMALLGAVLARIEPGLCEIHLPYKPELTQQHGFYHAGMVATVADNAAGYAGYSLMPAGTSVLTVEFKINLMAPAKGELVIARGQVIKPGRTLTIAQATVTAVNEGHETECALLQQTLICIHGREDPG
ncbi:MAG: hotdog fold thioesterase [Azospirillum sp.]|nr:hotdog fold thioesterase [Azospirillum sp.]